MQAAEPGECKDYKDSDPCTWTIKSIVDGSCPACDSCEIVKKAGSAYLLHFADDAGSYTYHCRTIQLKRTEDGHYCFPFPEDEAKRIAEEAGRSAIESNWAVKYSLLSYICYNVGDLYGRKELIIPDEPAD